MLTLQEVVEITKEFRWLYYIYVLHRPDGVPFYVGKGSKQNNGKFRVAYHETEARRGHLWKNPNRNHLKLNVIRKIWSEGGEVGYSIDSVHQSLESANEREVELIAHYGRRLHDDGILTNLDAGGAGCHKSEATLKAISDGLKRYYAEHPEALEKMSEVAKERFDSPEVREKARQSSIAKATAAHLEKWRQERPEEFVQHLAAHSGRMKKWYEANPEEAAALAARRNEVLKSDEHRQKMAERTKKFIQENPEADKQRRAKTKETKAAVRAVYDQCLAIIHARLVADGKVRATSKVDHKSLYNWKKRGLIQIEIPDGRQPIEVWERFRDSLYKQDGDE